MNLRALIAEFLGTLLLVVFGVGVATFSPPALTPITIPLAFGFVLLALAYALGPISGCHVNPAVTIGMLGARRISVTTAVSYWVAQCVGAIAGAAIIFAIAKQVPGLQTHDKLGTDGYGSRSMLHLSMGGAFVAEVVLTFMFVIVVLRVTEKLADKANPGAAGLAIGIALGTVHLLGVPLTGTSVNPARSLGPALFAGGGALSQLWLFIVAPLVGGLIAAGAHYLLHSREEAAADAEPAA